MTITEKFKTYRLINLVFFLNQKIHILQKNTARKKHSGTGGIEKHTGLWKAGPRLTGVTLCESFDDIYSNFGQ